MQNIFSKRNIIIAAAVILIIIVGLWFFFSKKSTGGTNDSSGSSGGNFLSRLFPTIENRTPPPPQDQNPANSQTPANPQNQMVSAASALVTDNVSGAILFKRGKISKIRYIERATGHVFEMDPDGQNKNQVSNTTIPGIFEVAWSPLGDRAILKYESHGDLNILSANFTASTTQGIFLSPKIKDAVFSPKGDKIAYILPGASETTLIISSPDNKNQRVLFKSQFSSWRVYWPEDSNIFIANWPASSLDGFLYRINVSSGAFEKISGPALGLLASTNGKSVLISSFDPTNQTILTSVFDFKSRLAKPSTLKIIPEKCAWSQLEANVVFCAIPLPLTAGDYPDDWYQGKISFADIFTKINTATLNVDTMQIGAPDLTNLSLSQDEKTAIFLNKRDGSLWKIDLTQILSSKKLP